MMRKNEYAEIESYMLDQMRDSAHDKHHVYRVLNSALDIAGYTDNPDMDVLVAACLLHDIGRDEQFSDVRLDHAKIGGDKAYAFLQSLGWPYQKASHVKDCISSHRYRLSNPPVSLEAKILYDADKLEACGALGMARTLIYGGQVSEPLYIMDESGGIVVDGGGADISSFFQEYNYKLKNVYGSFHTARAKEIASKRRITAKNFYAGLYDEVASNYENGTRKYLARLFDENAPDAAADRGSKNVEEI